MPSWPAGYVPAARNAARRSGSATPRSPRPSKRSCSSAWHRTGTPPNYDCGACGYATCAEFLHASKELRKESDGLEFTGPTCNRRDIDLGIAVGSAARTASLHAIDCRCQTRVAVAARKLGHITAEIAVALSLSVTHKAIGFDRRMPEIDFEALDLPGTGTLPVGIAVAVRSGGARNRQQPRRPTVRR